MGQTPQSFRGEWPIVFAPTVLDRYSIKARLTPALLAGLPAALALAVILDMEWWNEGIVSLASAAGLSFLLAQVARVLGKRCESAMFTRWGGKPSVAMLRHCNARIDRHTKARYHRNASVLAGVPMPTAEQELADPRAAEDAYEAATKALIATTRDTKKFRLLFDENINYGFCRNMCGLKPVGLVLSVAGLFIGGWRAWNEIQSASGISPFAAITAGTSILLLYVWLFVVNADWPKTAAYAYADRLMEASDHLVTGPKP